MTKLTELTDSFFRPNSAQFLVKARLSSDMEAGSFMFDATSLSLNQIVALSGDKRILKWAKEDSRFLPWLLDKNDFKTRVAACAEEMIERLMEIVDAPLEPKMLTAKDKLAAMNIILQLADKFPNKRKEIAFLDRDVGKMDESEVDRKLLEMKAKMATVEVIDAETEDSEDE